MTSISSLIKCLDRMDQVLGTTTYNGFIRPKRSISLLVGEKECSSHRMQRKVRGVGTFGLFVAGIYRELDCINQLIGCSNNIGYRR